MPVAAPRPASTVVLLRPGPRGCEVYLQKRADTLRFAPGCYVFPGGALDPEDGAPEALARLGGEGRWVSGDPDVTPAHAVAALRECYEEAGVLLARDAAGRPAHADAGRAARLAAARPSVEARGGAAAFVALLHREALTLDGGALRYVSHWVTPSWQPLRFDTRFFLAALPDGASPGSCSGESVEGGWWDPRAALAACEAGRMQMLRPTETMLWFLRQFDTFEEVVRACDDASLKVEGRRG
ncbi:MAG TPA: NUDIX hydrolase [Thermodesulfobacteriota bacterium]